MSDILFVEFYDGVQSSEPAVSVLAMNGGNSPDSAAETLADFFLQVGDSLELDWCDASALATRFIMRQQYLHSCCSELDRIVALPMAKRPTFGHQLVRIYKSEKGPSVEWVEDAYTKPEEVAVANYILQDIVSSISTLRL